MPTFASVRIKSDRGSPGAAPDRQLAAQVAALLREHGFDVRRVGRFSISVAADESVFARELGVSVRQGLMLRAKPAARDRRLADLIDLVEVAPTPVSF